MLKTQLRFSSIKIESPIKVKETWIHLVIEKVIWDGENIKEIIPRFGMISKPFTEFQMELKTYTDPVTQETHTLSGVGVSLGILNFVLPWVVQKYGGSVDEKGVLWL